MWDVEFDSCVSGRKPKPTLRIFETAMIVQEVTCQWEEGMHISRV